MAKLFIRFATATAKVAGKPAGSARAAKSRPATKRATAAKGKA